MSRLAATSGPGGPGGRRPSSALIERFPVHVIVERRPATSRWLDHVWRAVAVLPGRAEAPAWSVLSRDGGVTRFLAGDADVAAHRGDTVALRDNLAAPAPSVYVVLRPASGPVGWTLYAVTVDPTEAHAHADCGTDLVEALPMPAPLGLWLDRFVTRHHVERPVIKRQRDRSEKRLDRPGSAPAGKSP